MSGLRAIAFSSRRLPMKHHGQTTSDTTWIGSSVAAALADGGIGSSSMFEEKIGRPEGKRNTVLGVVALAISSSPWHDVRDYAAGESGGARRRASVTPFPPTEETNDATSSIRPRQRRSPSH